MKLSENKLFRAKVALVSVVILFCIYQIAGAERMTPFGLRKFIPLSFLHAISIPLFISIFIPFVFVVRGMVKAQKRAPGGRAMLENFPFGSAAWFIGLMALSLLAGDMQEIGARWAITDFLYNLSGEVAVSIDGEGVGNPDEVTGALRRVAALEAHHSHPTGRIKIEVADAKGVLDMELRRDSARPREYWVYYIPQGSERRFEAGGIVTSLFDNR